jgi:membrane protease subunit (stomatin/prohibitin family)
VYQRHKPPQEIRANGAHNIQLMDPISTFCNSISTAENYQNH